MDDRHEQSTREADDRLLQELHRAFDRARRRSGPWLACRPGCDECCHRLFPITRLDALRLRRGLAELEARDACRARAIRQRARDGVDRISTGFPGETETGRLDPDEQALDRFFERHDGLPCPALDPGTGCCDLYDSRPVACRIYGPPLRFGERSSPPCRLCFDGASPTVIERCRLEPDPEGREQKILAGIGVPPGEEWETLIAFALCGLADG